MYGIQEFLNSIFFVRILIPSPWSNSNRKISGLKIYLKRKMEKISFWLAARICQKFDSLFTTIKLIFKFNVVTMPEWVQQGRVYPPTEILAGDDFHQNCTGSTQLSSLLCWSPEIKVIYNTMYECTSGLSRDF